MWTLLCALSWALTPEQADDRIRSMNDLEAVPELARPVDQPIRLKQGVIEVTLTDGVMVPVFSGHYAGAWEREAGALLRKLRQGDPDATLPGPDDRGDRELVGFVWVRGEGTLAVELPHEADAMELANRQVLYGGKEASDLRKVAFGIEPFTTSLEDGLWLSADPSLDALFLGPETTDPYEVIVWDLPGDLSRAPQLLEQRLQLWDDLGIDVGERIAAERVAMGEGAVLEPFWLIDLLTADRYHRIATVPAAADRWLAWIDRGHLSTSWESQVVTAGMTPGGAPRWAHVSGVPMPPRVAGDPTSPPARSLPMAVAHVQARVLAAHQRNGMVLPVELTNRVTLRAEHDVLFVDLEVPRVEAEADSFVWVKASLVDGTPLARPEQVGREGDAIATVVDKPRPQPKPKKKPFGPDDDDDEEEESKVTAHRVRLVFPEAVRAGEEVVVDLQWTDVWPLAHLSEVDNIGMQSDGVTSGMQRFLAAVQGGTGEPYAYDVAVGLPEDSPLSVAVSGPMEEPTLEGGWRMTRVHGVQQARYPNVVVGRYRTHADKAKQGMPAVRVSLLQGDKKRLAGLASQARGAIAYYEGYLPPYGLPEYHIVEAPSAWSHTTWVAPHAMQMAQTMRIVDRTMDGEGFGWRLFGHEIAHQWWGQQAQPATLEDRWMIETFAEVFACMFLAKVHEKAEPCVERHEDTRKWIEGDDARLGDPRFSLSLAEAYQEGLGGSAYYEYGPYLMQQMLRPRIGNQAFFRGLEGLLRAHPRQGITNEQLQAAFEAASGEELGDFFDFWVRQGILPSVEVEVEVHPTVAEIRVTSDVPFGVFDVPVVFTEPGGRQWVSVVEVVHGEGYAELEAMFRRGLKVEVDPGNRTLLKRHRLGLAYAE